MKLEEVATRRGRVVDPREGILTSMHHRRIIKRLRSMSMDHALVIRSISDGKGQLPNGVLSPKRIAAETMLTEERVRQVLEELKSLKETL